MGEPVNESDNQRSDYEALRELALRLLASRFMGPEAGASEPRLLVGQMPAELPVELPLPEDARVLGTFVKGLPTIVIDTTLPGEAVVAFYRDQLRSRGWSEQEPFAPHQGGFVHSMFTDRAMGDFFPPGGQLRLFVNATPAPDGRATSVQLSLHADAQQMDPRRGTRGRDPMSLFPAIRPPAGGRQLNEGGGGGGDRVSAYARLEGDFDVPSLVTHYTEELVRGGWERSDGGHSGPVAWSTWTFRDDDGAAWRGLLLILRRTDLPGRFDLLVKAEYVDERPPHSGIAGGSWSTMGLIGGWTASASSIQSGGHGEAGKPPQPEPGDKPQGA